MSAAGEAETRRAGAARLCGGRRDDTDTARWCKEAEMSAGLGAQ
jgi:hypothetical protein